ncbi:MAG: hypothetical protein COB02_15850 [Candidatus Cloacimonadota bacterium]|nr:MAG: hypothetical protein COB02_15850 [Candidatus Cloacimonadota bacterium]
MKKSIIHSIRFLFSSYYLLFSLLVFGIFFLVIQQDYWYTMSQAFTQNDQKIRELEALYDKKLTEIKSEIKNKTQLKTESEALYLRENYPQISDSILKKYLTIGQYHQVKRNKIFPPIVIQAFQIKDIQFDKIDKSIHSLFAPKQALISSSEVKIVNDDFPLSEEIKKLNIKITTRKDIQNFEISKNDLNKLHDLGNHNRPSFFENEQFSQLLYEDLIHTSGDDFKLLKTSKKMKKYSNFTKSYFSQSAFGLWIYQYVLRLEGRLGARPNPFMEMIDFVFPDPLQKRSLFINARSIKANQSMYWNCFPNDYGTIKGDKNREKFLLFPHTIITSTINKAQLIHSIIPNIILDEKNKIDYGIQLEMNNSSLLHIYKYLPSNKHISHFLKNETKPSFFQYHLNKFIPFNKAPQYFTQWYQNKKSKKSNQQSFLFSFTNDRNEVFLASSAISKKLSGSRVTVYQNKSNLFFYFYLRWIFTSLIYLITIPLFFTLKKRYSHEISEAIRESLYFIVHEKQEKFYDENQILFHETENLKSKMKNLITKINKERFYHRLNLGLRSILNTPHKPFKYYLEEMYYFSRDLSTDFCWELIEKPKNIHSCLVLNFTKEHRDFLKKLNLPSTLCFQFKNTIDKESRVFKIFSTYFKELVEKSYLEGKFFQKQKLDSDLELGGNVLKSLLPKQLEVKTDKYHIYSTYVQGTYIAGDFYTFKESDNHLHFYLADLSRTGLGASLIAAYLKPFLDSIIEKSPEPSKVLHLCNQFLTKKNFPDLFVTVFYGTIDLNTKKLQYSCAGLRPMFLISDEITELSTNGLPLGISLDAKYKTKEITIKSGEYIYCYTRELLSAFCSDFTLKGLEQLKKKLNEKNSLEINIKSFHSMITSEQNSLQDDFMQLGIQIL